jgi:hypothetical protein
MIAMVRGACGTVKVSEIKHYCPVISEGHPKSVDPRHIATCASVKRNARLPEAATGRPGLHPANVGPPRS